MSSLTITLIVAAVLIAASLLTIAKDNDPPAAPRIGAAARADTGDRQSIVSRNNNASSIDVSAGRLRRDAVRGELAEELIDVAMMSAARGATSSDALGDVLGYCADIVELSGVSGPADAIR